MFNVTRLAVKATNLSRNTIKAVKTKKIKINNASADFQDFYNHIKKNKNGYGKNIFENVKNWIKFFIESYKQIQASIKDELAEFAKAKEIYGERLLKKEKKIIHKNFFDKMSESMNKTKSELKALLAKKK